MIRIESSAWPSRRALVALLLTALCGATAGSRLPSLSNGQLTVALAGLIGITVAVAWPRTALLAVYAGVLCRSLGLISLAPLAQIGPIDGNDVVWGLLLLLAAPDYLRRRRDLESSWFPRIELAWLAFVAIFAIEALRSPASSLSETLDGLHIVHGFLLFFASVAVLDSRARFKQVVAIGLVIAILGNILTVLQSLHGLEDITNSPFYDVGAWPGNKQMVGDIARVNLPVSNWISSVVVMIVGLSFLRFRWWYVLLGCFLMLTVFVNFARSLWLAMLAAIVVQILLLASYRRLSTKTWALFLVPPLIVVIGLQVAPLVGFEGLNDAISSRLVEGSTYVSGNTGTWAIRLDDQADALRIWSATPLLGIGTAFSRTIDVAADLGLANALLSFGLVGLAIEAWVLAVCAAAALSTFSRASIREPVVTLTALGVISEIVLILVYQQWVNPRVFSVLGLCVALMLSAEELFGARRRSALEDEEALGAPARHRSAPLALSAAPGATREGE